MAMWFVPLGPVLDAHGLHGIKPFAFAASALAAFVSPLVFGAMADRHASPVKVLRGLAITTAVSMAAVSTAIQYSAPAWLVLGLIQFFYLSYAPMFSISSALVLARLEDAKREFAPVRALATFGWMAGCWLVSALNADASSLAGYSGAAMWLGVSLCTFFLPTLEVPSAVEHLTWRERFGWDALTLFRNPDHRVVFVTAALFNVPLAAFYPYAPAHLRDLGLSHTSAWMSFAQVTELIATFSLGWLLLNWRLKWIVAAGLGFGVLRFALSAVNGKYWLLAGVALHGASFALVYITAQIYLEQRVDPAWRTRAQALLSLMGNGVGNLLGYLGSGWWFAVCSHPEGTQWPVFWGGLAVTVGAVLVYFLTAYRGRKRAN